MRLEINVHVVRLTTKLKHVGDIRVHNTVFLHVFVPMLLVCFLSNQVILYLEFYKDSNLGDNTIVFYYPADLMIEPQRVSRILKWLLVTSKTFELGLILLVLTSLKSYDESIQWFFIFFAIRKIM